MLVLFQNDLFKKKSHRIDEMIHYMYLRKRSINLKDKFTRRLEMWNK